MRGLQRRTGRAIRIESFADLLGAVRMLPLTRQRRAIEDRCCRPDEREAMLAGEASARWARSCTIAVSLRN
jgi:hypothetical protein